MVLEPSAERVGVGDAEDQVLLDRRVHDVAVGIEHLDVLLVLRLDEPLAEIVARGEDAARRDLDLRLRHPAPAGRADRRRLRGRRSSAPRAAAPADPPARSRRPPRSRSSRRRRRFRGCRRPALRCAAAAPRARSFSMTLERRVAQAVDQAVEQARLREIGVGLGVADAPAGDGIGQRLDRRAVDRGRGRRPAPSGARRPRPDIRRRRRPGRPPRPPRRGFSFTRRRFEQRGAGLVADDDAGRGDVASRCAAAGSARASAAPGRAPCRW